MSLDEFTKAFTYTVVGFIIGVFVASYQYRKNSSPVEDITKIDSLKAVNDSIKIKVEQLDSVKNAKVIEVSTLDNDSTLKLFYKLVSE